MNSIQEKVHTTSRKISTALKTGYILMIMISVLAILGILILTLSTETTRTSFLEAFNVTTNNGTIISIIPQNLFTMFIALFIYSLFMSSILFYIWCIFKDISNDYTPFNKKHTIRIKRIAFITIILSIIGSFFDSLVDLYTIGGMGWHIDFMGIVFGVIIYCIALVFDYGCELQRQSDETL